MKAVNVSQRLRIAAVAVLVAAPLSACGFNAPTDEVYNPGVGVNNRDGQVDVLHAAIVSGSDGSGTVIAGLVNNDQQTADKLTAVAGSGKDASLSITMGGTTDIAADGFLQLADEGKVSATGDQIKPGHFITLTFSFQNAEDVTLDVPVVSNEGDFANVPVPSA